MNKNSLIALARGRSFSIQSRSLFYILSLGIMLSALLTWRGSLQQKSMVYDELEKRAVLMTNNLAEACVRPIILEDIDEIKELIEKYRKQEDVLYILLRDKNGNILAEESDVGPVRLDTGADISKAGPIVSRVSGSLHVVGQVVREHRRRSDAAELLSGHLEVRSETDTRQQEILGTVRMGLSTRRASESIRRFVWQSAIGTTGILALGGLLMFILFNRTIIRPLYTLVEVTREVSRGNLNQQIEKLGSGIEFTLLASSFNKMVMDLKRVKDELMSVNQDLEERVRERTFALENANNDLLKANVHLKELIEMKSRFVSMVSHELRTPITSIKGFVLTIQRYKQRLSGEQIDKYLKIIHGESERLARLIEELLDISRIQEGKIEIRPAIIDLKEMIHRIFDRYHLKTNRVNFLLKADAERCVAYADSDKVEQIIVNLLDNALRYSPDGGNVTVHMFNQSSSVVLEVLDEGPGLPDDDIEKIFEPFYRVDNEINTRNPGTGLGLPISRSLSEAMGGHLWAGNREPRGACFAFILPQSAPTGVA